MWEVCDCKDQSLPLSISVSIFDCGEFKPLWRLALALFPSPLFAFFSNPVTLSFSAFVSLQVGLLGDGNFLRIAGRLKLQSRPHTCTQKRNTHTTWTRVCGHLKIIPICDCWERLIPKPWTSICCCNSFTLLGRLSTRILNLAAAIFSNAATRALINSSQRC